MGTATGLAAADMDTTLRTLEVAADVTPASAGEQAVSGASVDVEDQVCVQAATTTAVSNGFWNTGVTAMGATGDGRLLGGDGTQTFNLHGVLRRLVAEDGFRALVQPWIQTVDASPATPDGLDAAALPRQVSSTGTDIGGDATAWTFSPSASSEGFWGTSRTIMGETMQGAEGGDGISTFHLHGLLRRLVADGELDLHPGLARTAHQMLQLSSVAGGQRLSRDEVEALPKVCFEEEERRSCAICLESYKRGELLTALKCDHFFHSDCISLWLRRSTQCPLCRTSQGGE